MQSNDFVTPEHILSDVLPLVGDFDLRKGLTRGWYISQIQAAIERLALDTYFNVVTGDFTMPSKTLQDKMPANCFNIREMYLWSGDCCTPQSSVIVHYKRLYNNKPGGADYTALRKDTGSEAEDPFYQPFLRGFSLYNGDQNLHYANIQNGLIMFSSNCSSWDNYRIVYNGMGGEFGEQPIIPRILRDVVIDFVVERVYRAMAAREPRLYRILQQDAFERLFNRQVGTWWEAMRRISSMDSWMKDAYAEYQNRGNW